MVGRSITGPEVKAGGIAAAMADHGGEQRQPGWCGQRRQGGVGGGGRARVGRNGASVASCCGVKKKKRIG